MSKRSRIEPLALQAVKLARARILEKSPLLASALGSLECSFAKLKCCFATDGQFLFVDVEKTVGLFMRSGHSPACDLLHSVLHCVLLHPFVPRDADRGLWDLSCDICACRLASAFQGFNEGVSLDRKKALAAVSRVMGEKSFNAKLLYSRMQSGCFDEHLQDWFELFAVDDHDPWYGTCSTLGNQGQCEGDDAGDAGEMCQEGSSFEFKEKLEQKWSGISSEVMRGMESQDRHPGVFAGMLEEDMEVEKSRKVDLREFLKQFAVCEEVVGISDSEFDYIFYTYGLCIYGKLPLIEPLEYRDERRIRELVIVIDTSGSVWGDKVKKFIDTVYDVLSSAQSFARNIKLRILQCDTKVQQDDEICDLSELKSWCESFKAHGGGGTDFRAPFEHVDALIERRELVNLGGLIYFTDGWGEYPSSPPAYKSAFLFYDDDHHPDNVPAWVIQLTLGYGD